MSKVTKQYDLIDIGTFTVEFTHDHIRVSGDLAGDFFDGPVEAIVRSCDKMAPEVIADIMMIANAVDYDDSIPRETDGKLDKSCARLIEVANTLDHMVSIHVDSEYLPDDLEVLLGLDAPPLILAKDVQLVGGKAVREWSLSNSMTSEEERQWTKLFRVMDHCWEIIKGNRNESSVRSEGCGVRCADDRRCTGDNNGVGQERGDFEMTDDVRRDSFEELERRVAGLERMAGELYGKTDRNAKAIAGKADTLDDFDRELQDIGNTPIEDAPRIFRLHAGSSLIVLWVKGWNVSINLPGEVEMLSLNDLKERLENGKYTFGREYLKTLIEHLEKWGQKIEWNGVPVEVEE